MSEPPPQPTWRRKTDSERGRDLRRMRLDPRRAALAGLLAGVVGLGVGLLAVEQGADRIVIVLLVALFLCFAVPTAVVLYILQMFRAGRTLPYGIRVGICDRCFRLTLDGRLDHCECGGQFEDADGWALNRCPKCGYDLRGNTTARCPECGLEVTPAAVVHATSQTPSPNSMSNVDPLHP